MKEWYHRLIYLWTRLWQRTGGRAHYVGGSDSLPPPLSPEEEAELMTRLGEQGILQKIREGSRQDPPVVHDDGPGSLLPRGWCFL